MKETVKNNLRVDWATAASILFWILIILVFIIIVSSGRTKIPIPTLEITEASVSRQTLTIAHRDGDPVRFANTKCIWTPDISSSDITQNAGSLVMIGEEIKQGKVSDLEPGEVAGLGKDIKLVKGNFGRLSILDLKSGQQIYSKTVEVKK